MRNRLGIQLCKPRLPALTCYALVFPVLLSMLAGCSKGSSTAAPSSLRVVNSTHSSTLALELNSTTETSVGPAAVSGYVSIAAGNYTASVTDTSDSSLSPATQVIALGSGGAYTEFAYQRAGTVVLTNPPFFDNLATPTAGFSSLKVANVSPDAGPLDVYLEPAGFTAAQLTTGIAPNLSQNLVPGQTVGPESITAGSYTIIATAYNRQSDIRLVLPITLASQEIGILAMTSTTGGALVDATLFQQGNSTVSFTPAANARVRLVAGYTLTTATTPSTATAVVNGTTLTAAEPTVGAYTSLAVGATGTTSYTVSIDGVAVTVPAQTFAGGGDYTIVVYGTQAAPQVAVITDDNQFRGVADALIQVVDASVTGGFSLTYNGVSIASASYIASTPSPPYIAVSPAAASSLALFSTALTTNPDPVSSNLNLASGGVYTLFVLGSATAPTIFLVQDR